MKLADVLNYIFRRPGDREAKAKRLMELTVEVEEAVDDAGVAVRAWKQRQQDEQVILAARNVVHGLRGGERR